MTLPIYLEYVIFREYKNVFCKNNIFKEGSMELYINIFVGFCMFVIGTLFGSFFSLATYRIPRHQDILVKRSYCPNCNHNLGFFDLIPI